MLSTLSKIRTSSLAHNVAWMMIGQGGNFFLQAGYFLLLARLLGASEYGIFSGAFALVSSVSPYSALGSPMIFMRYVSAERSLAQVYWGNILVVTGGTTLVLLAAMLAVGSKLLGAGSLGLIAVLVIANCLMSQIVNSASIVFQTFEQLRATAWLRAASNLIRLLAVAILLMNWHHVNAFQCALGLMVASGISAAIALVWVWQKVGKMRLNAGLFTRHFWEGMGFSVAGSTQAVYNDVDKMMLSHYGMNVVNGIYTMAYRVVDFATTPVSAIDAAVLPRYFSLNKEGLPSVMRMARKVLPIAVAAGLGAAVVTLLVSPVVVRIVGHGFDSSLQVIRWLCVLPVLRGVHQLAGGALTATGRQNHRTVAQLIVAGLNVVLNLSWIPAHGWHGAAWASLVSDGSLGAITLVMMFYFLRTPNAHQVLESPQTVEQRR